MGNIRNNKPLMWIIKTVGGVIISAGLAWGVWQTVEAFDNKAKHAVIDTCIQNIDKTLEKLDKKQDRMLRMFLRERNPDADEGRPR